MRDKPVHGPSISSVVRIYFGFQLFAVCCMLCICFPMALVKNRIFRELVVFVVVVLVDGFCKNALFRANEIVS